MADSLSKIVCTYCQEEIHGVRVQCCVCSDYDECLQCFACGAEIGSHKNDHDYRLVDPSTENGWTNREELQLLEAMDLSGFGNWEGISKHLKTRTPEEVREKYLSKYIDGNIGRVTWKEVEADRPMIPEHSVEDNGPLSSEITSRLPPLGITPQEAQQIGYITYRDDFEKEYDHTAEQLITGLFLRITEDTDMEMALKLSLVDMYIRRLRERYRRKRVAKDYQLATKFFASQRETTDPLTNEQKEFRDDMRVFSQFLTAGEYERLIERIERERELKFRLNELYKYRSLGLTTQEDIVHYEQHVAYQQQQQMRQNKAGSSGFGTTIQEFRFENGKEERDQSSIDGKYMLQQGEENSNNNLDNVQSYYGNLLSPHEEQLCNSLNLEPMQYKTLKTIIIQEHILEKKGIQQPKEKFSNDSISNSKIHTVKDIVRHYLNVSGWI